MCCCCTTQGCLKMQMQLIALILKVQSPLTSWTWTLMAGWAGHCWKSVIQTWMINLSNIMLLPEFINTWKSGGGGRHCPTKALLLIKRLFHSSTSQKETQILNKQTQRYNFPALLTALWLFSLFRDASKTASSPPTSPRPGSASGSSTAPASGVVPPRQQKPSSSGATRKKAPQKKKKGGKGGW